MNSPIEARDLYVRLHMFVQTMDLGDWEIDNYEHLPGTQPGNIGKPQLLISWEPGNTGKPDVSPKHASSI